MHSFSGQSIVITGASAGIGQALALALAPDRAAAGAGGPQLGPVAGSRGQVRKARRETLVVPTDVTDERQCRQLVEQAVARFGSLDVLVNNAGRAMWSRFDELQDTGPIEAVMRLNYLGSVYPTFHALPHLRRSKGRLVAMASVAGLTGVPVLSGYSASKHAVIGFFESLRIELAESGVSVTIVAPDWVQSEILDRSLDAQGRPLGHSPLDQRAMMPTDRAAERIKRAIARRERLVLMSGRSKSLGWGKLLFPSLVDRLTAASMAGMARSVRSNAAKRRKQRASARRLEHKVRLVAHFGRHWAERTIVRLGKENKRFGKTLGDAVQVALDDFAVSRQYQGGDRRVAE